jgi:glucosamine-6-phosphate deaminase
VWTKIFQDKRDLAGAVAEEAASDLRQFIQQQGRVRIIAATGAAQFEFPANLTAMSGVDWQRVEWFHLE